MLKRHQLPIALLALSLLAVGCGSSEPKPPSLSGTWSGTISGTQNQVLSVDLLDVSGTLFGSATLAPTPSGSLGLAVSGTFVAPSFVATLESGVYPTMYLDGSLSSDRTALDATITGAGFTGQPVTLAKQR